MSAVARTRNGRSGPTTSCAECKRRKIRCRWPTDINQRAEDDTRPSCSNCIARGKQCLPQRDPANSDELNRSTARDRIAALESQVADLTNLVKGNQTDAAPAPREILVRRTIPFDASQRLWHTLCAVDHFNTIFWRLSSETSRCAALGDLPIVQDGSVYAPAYIYQLARILRKMQQLHHEIREDCLDTQFSAILEAHGDLQALSAGTPKKWWHQDERRSQMDQLIQFWHHHLLARLHLRTALSNDDHSQFELSRKTFTEASRNAVVGYLSLRSAHPDSMVPQSVDLQASTVAAFILLAGHSPRGEQELQDDLLSLFLVHRVIDTLRANTAQTEAVFTEQAIKMLESLHQVFANADNEQHYEFTLRIPYLGNVSFKHASAQLGVGDARCNSLPWTFGLDLGQSWPTTFCLERRALTTAP